MICDHMICGNVHLHMSTHSSFRGTLFCYSSGWGDCCITFCHFGLGSCCVSFHHFGWGNHSIYCYHSWRESSLEQKKIILMKTNAYHIPLNKSTNQATKIKIPFIPADNGWDFLATTKKECYTHMHPYIVHVKFQNSHK